VDRRPRRWNLSELWWALPKIGRVGNGRAIGVLSVWIWWDRFLLWRWKPKLVRPDGLIWYRLIRHRGSRVTLKDGTVISKGDSVVEIHFNNPRLLRELDDGHGSPFEALAIIEGDFAALAQMVADARLGPVRGLYTATLFSIPGRRVGFEVHPVPHTLAWSLRRYFFIGMIPIYQRDGWKQFDRMRRNRWPAELWMSTRTLQQRHLRPPA
jgi:hypothetical protein